MKILIIDNYDSFVYNLVHYLEELDCQVSVLRNDEVDIDEIKDFDKILISPGPGLPKEAEILEKTLAQYGKTKSILGICLGQQAIAEHFGAELQNLNQVYHGVATKVKITVNDEPLFLNLEKEIVVGRYHSWVVNNLPECLEATSFDENGSVMSLRHRVFDVKAVQYHPESILTPQGKSILKNWINS